MGKISNNKRRGIFTVDTFVSRDKYRCAVVLEEVLTKLNDRNLNIWINNFFRNYSYRFKLVLQIRKEDQPYFGKFVVDAHSQKIRMYFAQILTNIPEYAIVESLMLNIVQTKYKIEVIRK